MLRDITRVCNHFVRVRTTVSTVRQIEQPQLLSRARTILEKYQIFESGVDEISTSLRNIIEYAGRPVDGSVIGDAAVKVVMSLELLDEFIGILDIQQPSEPSDRKRKFIELAGDVYRLLDSAAPAQIKDLPDEVLQAVANVIIEKAGLIYEGLNLYEAKQVVSLIMHLPSDQIPRALQDYLTASYRRIGINEETLLAYSNNTWVMHDLLRDVETHNEDCRSGSFSEGMARRAMIAIDLFENICGSNDEIRRWPLPTRGISYILNELSTCSDNVLRDISYLDLGRILMQFFAKQTPVRRARSNPPRPSSPPAKPHPRNVSGSLVEKLGRGNIIDPVISRARERARLAELIGTPISTVQDAGRVLNVWVIPENYGYIMKQFRYLMELFHVDVRRRDNDDDNSEIDEKIIRLITESYDKLKKAGIV